MPTALAPGGDERDATVAYGEYFLAIRDFLQRHLPDVIARLSINAEENRAIETVDVTIEKHGAFYHPASVRVGFGERIISFALNGAVSEVGRRWIRKEYQCLETLSRAGRCLNLPRTYGFGYGAPIHGAPVPFFVAEWMDGYCEFHWTRSPEECIMVWNPAKGRVPLSKDHAAVVYRNAVGILAACYELSTCRQILAWHNGAGDFILRPGDLAVKLIAARQYEALLRHDAPTPDEDALLAGLLIFVLTQTAWMRIDRLDGVGDVYWADDEWVRPIAEGVLGELDRKRDAVFADGVMISRRFSRFWRHWRHPELVDMAAAALTIAFPGRPELEIIHSGLERHVVALDAVIRRARSF